MNIVLGVGGGIAAYKSAELARLLMQRGHAVQVVMTASAQEFVRPLTFAALTGRKVITGLFASGNSDATLSSAIEHIGASSGKRSAGGGAGYRRSARQICARPVRQTISSLLTYWRCTGPVVLAPAMNTNMWLHAATQSNLEALRRRGHRIVDPGEGELACGMVGPGRLAEPEQIAVAVDAEIGRHRDLDGETVLITAGPTQEPLDPVRYISNRSSGKMGYALAEAAASRGAKVVLISGPVQLAPPRGCALIPVHTAREMRDQVFDNLQAASIIIKAAAVADFHLAKVPPQMMKKTAARLSLELDPTPDILAGAGPQERRPAADWLRRRDREFATGDTPQAGSQELRYGGWQPGGLPARTGLSNQDQNEVLLALRSGEFIPVPRASKREVADRIFDEILKLRLHIYATDGR